MYLSGLQNVFACRGVGGLSEGVKDAYTSADSQALKRTGIQANRQAPYIHIIPPCVETKHKMENQKYKIQTEIPR